MKLSSEALALLIVTSWVEYGAHRDEWIGLVKMLKIKRAERGGFG